MVTISFSLIVNYQDVITLHCISVYSVLCLSLYSCFDSWGPYCTVYPCKCMWSVVILVPLGYMLLACMHGTWLGIFVMH